MTSITMHFENIPLPEVEAHSGTVDGRTYCVLGFRDGEYPGLTTLELFFKDKAALYRFHNAIGLAAMNMDNHKKPDDFLEHSETLKAIRELGGGTA